MSDLKTYLASKYMSGPRADAILAHAGVDKKKRRKKPKNEDYVGGSGSASGSGLVLMDEDQWRGSKRKADIDFDGDDAPVIGKDVATFKKGQSSWSTVGATALPVRTRVKSEPRDGESPIPSNPEDDSEPKPKQQLTKRRGGLRTAAQMAEEAARAAEEAKARSPSPEPDGAHTQTVHRDRSGRVLDVEQLKQEARREELEEKLKEEERKEWTKGFVQREDREAAAKELKKMESKDVARYVDDAEMNREMREVERWNDPAAAFLTKSKKSKSKGPRYQVYKGSWSENRFGIRPGCRWDGVGESPSDPGVHSCERLTSKLTPDRGNGFEKKWILAQNAAARREYEGNQMDMEDM
ncbi:bud site selection-related protein [Trichosporon asahii var. asahii CBS 8904]|uniref:Bud site selection-related protein n=1 Tax=Trichosporon asahii var. asahii (strain CBS 8904) TaxID=1220162 RepID=K1VKR0_TRIAC|nr:bud site selection-related protein [Trichosporon asahii var. asahii CBS 8904]